MRWRNCAKQVIRVVEHQHRVGRLGRLEQRVEILHGVAAVLADDAVEIDLVEIHRQLVREQLRGQQAVLAGGAGKQDPQPARGTGLACFNLGATRREQSLDHGPQVFFAHQLNPRPGNWRARIGRQKSCASRRKPVPLG
jgi:hypothetical protein